MVTPQVQNPFKPKGIGAMLLTSDVPHSPKPKWKRFSAAMKYCTSGHGGLRPALGAMEKTPGRSPWVPSIAMRADKAIGPSHFPQVVDTSDFSAEPIFKFQQCSGVIFLHDPLHYILWALESSAYPRYFIYRIGSLKKEKLNVIIDKMIEIIRE
jgi:hypothetical protein